jgi:outer membrane protein TolC
MILLVLLVLVSTGVFAEPGARELLECTLKLRYRIQREGLVRSQISLADRKNLFLPGLRLSAGPAGSRTPLDSSNLTTATLTLEQRLFDPETSAAIDGAQASVGAATAQILDQALSDAILALEDLFQIQLTQKQIELIEIQLRGYNLAGEISATGSKLGVSDANDYLQLKGQIRFLETEMNRLRFDLNRRERVFRARYGFSPVSLSTIQAKTSDAPVDVSKLPAVSALKLQVEQARFEKMVYQKRLWPTLSLQASYSSISQGLSYPVSQAQAYPQRSGSIAIVADLSNFWREKEQRSIINALSETRSSELNFTLNNLKVEYEQIEAEIELLKTQLPLLTSRLALTQKSKELSREKLRLGRLGFLEFQQAESAAFSSANDLFSAELRAHQLKLRKDLAREFNFDKLSPKRCRL